ncbi:MAG TPA: RsmD family RNA methyltransferase [Gemmataceae bacterium]|jgi:16S rRNA (guanine(966)-N(2))-methyltransferase RsmD|nr:RsmD family RNA methyltransferase [Gemmataceae bacterium]
MRRTQRTQVRIVAGELRGRKIACTVTPELRPTPQMVREAFFSILGNAIPDRPFFDLFAGTGVIGMEAISRGASSATFLENDLRLARQIEEYLKEFEIADRASVLRADVYRWAERWQPPDMPVNIFLSPPFADLERRLDGFLNLVRTLLAKVPAGSVAVIQAELGFPEQELPQALSWERRQYGRNLLLIWVQP